MVAAAEDRSARPDWRHQAPARDRCSNNPQATHPRATLRTVAGKQTQEHPGPRCGVLAAGKLQPAAKWTAVGVPWPLDQAGGGAWLSPFRGNVVVCDRE